MRLTPPFSLLNEDLKTLPQKPTGLNLPLALLNDDVSLSPGSALFSDPRLPQRTGGSRTTSFSSSPSSFPTSPFDSPFHRLNPSSAVPFSWERQPGIPKLPAAAADGGERHHLPLPPALRSAVGFSREKRSGARDFDPFAVALAQCSKDSSGEDLEGMWCRRSGVKSVGIWRRTMLANRIGLISFNGSCKTTCAVSDATIALPRSAGRAAGSYVRMNRRRQ